MQTFLFNCLTVAQASYSMTAQTWSFNQWFGVSCLAVAGLTVAQLKSFL